MEVEEVTFHGNQTVKKDDGSGDYDGADWSDQNHDNDANDEGEHHWPICYIKGDTMGVSAKIKCNLPNAVSVTVRARIPANSPASGGSEIIFGPSGALTSSNGFIECPRIDATTANDSTKTNHLEKMEQVWEIQAAGSGKWVAISKTQHTFYSLYGKPIETSKLYHTVLHLACSIPGASNWNQVVDNVWANFAGPANVKAWNPTTRVFDRPLHYYKDGVIQQAVATTTSGLLMEENGQCFAWMELFLDALKIHGESTSQSVQINGGGDDGDLLLVIKNWQTVQNAPDPPHIRLPTADPNFSCGAGHVQYGDMISADGLPGQNTATPYVKIFGGHAVAKYNNIYYDPSYGVTYTSIQDFEEKAIFGYGVNDVERDRRNMDPADIRTQSPAFSIPIFDERNYPN
jgi:hypothetical protein